MRKSIFLLATLTLAACAQPGLISSDRETLSPIALCGGGLDERTKTAAEAAFRQNSAKATGEVIYLIKGILDANQVSEEKYAAYLECVQSRHEALLAISEKERNRETCQADCQATKASCDIESKKMFDLCIAKELRGCISDCKQYVRTYRLWHVADCHSKYCNWNKMEEDTRALHIDRCNRREAYVEQVADCGADYQRCKVAC